MIFQNNPVDRGFNVAVLHIADRLFPTGFDVSPVAPSTLPELKAHIARTGRMLVWNGASDRTIFDDDEVNFAFRAWHDWCHWKNDLPFTLAGEIAAANMQAGHLIGLYGAARSRPWRALLRAEVVGQATYFETHGNFPEDQRAFDLAYVA